MKKKILTLIWTVLEIYFLDRMYIENSTGSRVACDYLGACMLFTPLLFPFILFLIWKPENRSWAMQIIYSVVATIIIVAFVLFVSPLLLQF